MAITLTDFKPAPCEECGMGAVNHKLERVSQRVDGWFSFLFAPLDKLSRFAAPFFDTFLNYLAPALAKILFKTGLAIKIAEPDEHSSETAQCLWAEASRRGIDMYEVRFLGLPRRQFIASHEGKSVAFEGLPRPARFQKSIAWVDDKAEVKKRFKALGFPVAEGGSVHSESKALALFRKLRKPVIVKPREGSGGRHTTVHVENESELKKAYWNARVVAPVVIVEEELQGPVFRATLVDRKLVAVLRRDPPRVTGDGRATVRELAALENKNPLRRDPVFAEINVDSPAAARELTRQKLTPESAPRRGQEVYLHFKVNWGVGGTSWDETDLVHPENKKLFEDIGEYLDEDIVGIDFIISDIGKSWKESPRSGVIELNSLPLIGNHHFPYQGPVVNVAGAVWDMVFPESGSR